MTPTTPRLAINYSPQAEGLLRAGQLQFDLWKCSTPGSIAGTQLAAGTGKPAYVHFPFDAGRADLLATDWDEVERILDSTGTPYVNVHLNAKRSDFPGVDRRQERTAVRERFLASLSGLSGRFGAERVIAENVIYRGADGSYLQAAVDPELISEVLAITGCRLLLDTAHATITSKYLGVEPIERYVGALPVEQIAEIHVTGVVHDGNRLRDSMPMTESDWSVAEGVLRNVLDGKWGHPWVVALEYGGVGPSYGWRSEEKVISSDLARLATLVECRYQEYTDSNG